MGEPERGRRHINEKEAAIVHYISGKAIASALNKRRFPGASGMAWESSTTNGNWRRGTGILNNELCVGRLFWNRLPISKIRIPESVSLLYRTEKGA